MDTYRRFRQEYAHYWGVSPSTLYKVKRYSNSMRSFWMEMNGREVCVPLEVLVHNDPWRRY